MSKAYDYLNMKDEAIASADRIIAITLDSSKSEMYDQNEMLEIAQEAFTLRVKYLGKN